MTLRIGTLGAARITPQALIKPARSQTGVEVVAVAARDRSKAQTFADKHRIPRVLDGYDALVTDPEIDAIYNPLPNSHHKRWTLAAIAAGKHVLCEKPFTANAADAREVEAATAGSGLVVMEAFHWRYHPLAQRVVDLVADGAIGELRSIDVGFCFPLPMFGDIRWQYDLAGGALMDAGCYAVSMTRHLGGGEPTITSANASTLRPGVDRRVEARGTLPGGADVRIVASMLSRTLVRVSARLDGTNGSIHVLNPLAPQVYHRLTLKRPGSTSVERVGKGQTTYGCQLDAFAAAVAGGPPPITGVADAIANMTVIDAIYEAAGLPLRQSA